MIATAFLICALALPPVAQAANHRLTYDDAKVFLAIMEPARRYLQVDRAPILFGYNYFHFSEHLRLQGARAYSMTITLTGGHLHGHLEDIPFAHGALAAVVLMQKVSYAEFFEAIQAVCLRGVLMIEDKNLPYLGGVVLDGLGFYRTSMSWHAHVIYRRHELRMFMVGAGFDAFKAKRVLSPHVVHRSVLGAA